MPSFLKPGVFLTILAACVPARAGSLPAPAVEATLTLRLNAGRSTYRIGELIPLELEFRGHAGPDHYFSTASYDRSGRMRFERYRITPPGGSDDPLLEYFSSVGSIGGGLSSWHPLDGSPFVLRVHLNEWVRFTRPGDYRLVVESARLRRYSRQPAPPVVSAPVALHVRRATPGWAAAEVARAVAALEGRGPGTPEEAATTLRHLGTREAALALVSHYGAGGGDLRFDWLAGLVASPHRPEVVKAMEARVDSGDPVPPGFIPDLALLRSFLDRPAGPALGRFERQKAAACDYSRRWRAGLGRRGASAETVGALLEGLAEPADPECAAAPSAALEDSPALGRQAFLALPPATQALLIEHRWNAVGGPWIQPALEALYEAWRGDFRFPGAGDAALRRIVELDPARGRSCVLEEIRTGVRGILPETLTSLLAGPSPDLDGPLRERHRAARTEEDRAATMWLIARYGSDDLLPLVRGELERGPACEVEAAAITYLLEHDPSLALLRLQPGFDRSARPMCVAPPWWELARRRWDERVEEAAIAHLDGDDPRLVADTARVLGTYGSQRVKEPLLERFARWNEEWSGRQDELAALSAGPPPADSPALVENALVNALLELRSASLTREETERVRGLCLTGACRANVDAQVRSSRAR